MTLETVIWRPLLAEQNTSRSHSRSSASSRAIPIRKQIERVMKDPAFPTYWGAEQPGMQSGGQLEGEDLERAQRLFRDVYDSTLYKVEQYLLSIKSKYGNLPEQYNSHTLHKSLLARLLEPWMWHTAIFSATNSGWENFFSQRATKRSGGAQAEFREMADACLEIWETHTPTNVDYGEWHMPYLRDDDDFLSHGDNEVGIKTMISTGRCARVSYLNHDGVKSMEDDLGVYKKLVTGDPVHWSPLEFVATPYQKFHSRTVKSGNYHGWTQHRHFAEAMIDMAGFEAHLDSMFGTAQVR